MAIPKLDDAINDFSAGELDPDIKRSGSPLIKTGGRQMANWRVLNSHKKSNRPGRSALFLENGRIEEIAMPNGFGFFLLFDTNVVKVYNLAGVLLFVSAASYPWTAATLGKITYAVIGNSVYIAYPDGAPFNIPQVLTFDGVSSFTIAGYTETVTPGGQKRTAFYRISPQNITMQPSATTGNINITFNQNGILAAGQVGTRLRYCNRQLTIKSVIDSGHGTATVNEPLPPAQQMVLNVSTGNFNVGDVVKGSITGASGIVTSTPTTQQLAFLHNIVGTFQIGDTITGGTSGATGVVTSNGYYAGPPFDTTYYNVQLSTGTLFVNNELVTSGRGTSATTEALGGASAASMVVQIVPTTTSDNTVFTTSDTIVGPSGSATITSLTTIAPQAVSVWDDEVMNTFRGFPSSVFSDQGRLGLCNVPSVQGAIIWSAFGLYTDLYTGAQPDDSIFEISPDQSVVFYTIPGMESSEFVFTDRAIYYLPINASVPLQPGNVAFNKLSDYGILPGVQPRRADQSIIFVKAGGVEIAAVQTPGAYYRPNVVDNISEMHSHLFKASPPIAIAVPSGPTQFEETYIYIALANGTAVVGRYVMRNGLIEPGPEGKPTIGWAPWNGAGLIGWIAARQGDVIFLTVYPGLNGVGVVEKLDNTQYLDGALLVNNLPAPFVPPGGKGPLFKFPGPSTTVFLIDQGTRFMGTYNVDANGFLIPQNIDGENLTSSQLIAGQPWTAVFEPFMPHAPPGADQQQRIRKRKVAKGLVSVQNSSGFVFGTRRVPYYFVGEDPTQPAPLREDSYLIRPRGRSYDPRLVLTKDTPGPLIVNEYGFEVTV